MGIPPPVPHRNDPASFCLFENGLLTWLSENQPFRPPMPRPDDAIGMAEVHFPRLQQQAWAVVRRSGGRDSGESNTAVGQLELCKYR